MTETTLRGAAWRDGLEQWRREHMDRPWDGSKCSWCRTDREMARQEYEGPHVTWCPRYRPEDQRWWPVLQGSPAAENVNQGLTRETT